MMIAVEGMDGVGKTAISQHICEKYGFDFVEKPLHYFYNDGADNNYADFMTAAEKIYDINDPAIKSWYFGLGNIYVARKFKDRDVVVDRHLISNYYWNGDYSSEPIFQTIIEQSGVPDLTILLYATPETRMERLYKRDANDPDLFDPDKKDDGYKKMVYFANKFNLPYVLIDTENKSLEEVMDLVDIEVSKLKEETLRLVRQDGH